MKTGAKSKPIYMDTNYSFEERAADLVSRMTLEEKVAQIGNVAAAVNRLGVSGYDYWREALHGVARQGKATSFPSPLSMSNTWNRKLIHKMADMTATEARGKNNNLNLSYWSPTVNMARDPRWGRNEETFGEDPYLTGQLGIQFVSGMQGDDEKYLKTIATVKHFIANNCEKERRGGTSVMSEKTLREYYAKVFQYIVEGADPASAMSSYNAVTLTRGGETVFDYVPSAANPYTLIDLLRRNWGFSGYVTGDCGAVADLNDKAAYKQTLFPGEDISKIPQSATIAKSIQAGNDIDCGNASRPNGLEAVLNGYMSEEELNIAVYRLFLQRMRVGEFDPDPRYGDITPDVLEKDEHIAVAEELAEESWVLLKNEDNILPLKKDIKNMALVGALADEVVLGDYSSTPDIQITPYEGIKRALSETRPDAELNYLGGVTDDAALFSIKDLEFVLSGGGIRKIDLSKVDSVSGAVLSESGFENVTRKCRTVVKDVDFSNVESVRVKFSAFDAPGGSLTLQYGNGGPAVAVLNSKPARTEDEYIECSAEYTGTSGGYNQTADLYISAAANSTEFTIEKYKDRLDEADIIIAYAGTTLEDSSESHDRENILLPRSQSHVQALTDMYPDKTAVVMQTVGQIDTAPFEKGAKAILWTSYNGQTQGSAIGRILTGAANPSGRLTTTWYNASDLEKMPLNAERTFTENGVSKYYNNYNIQQADGFPGRTYQYYSGKSSYPFGYGLGYTEFAYSNPTVSKSVIRPGEILTVSIDVTNTGYVPGKETVQLYVSFPDPDGINEPLKQLKGFSKISLLPGETKTVELELDSSDFTLFDEKEQRIYVPNGAYSLSIAKNADDENALTVGVQVRGSLPSVLKTVKAIPTGLTVNGLSTFEDGAPSEPTDHIDSRVSAVMSDELVYNLSSSEATVVYESKNPDIAFVDDAGRVVSGIKEGVTTISASVTIDGVTKSDSFPVVCKLKQAVTKKMREEFGSVLDGELGSYNKDAYSIEAYNRVADIVEKAKNDAALCRDMDALNALQSSALEQMRSVKAERLTEAYTIFSENGAYLKNGRIDYDDVGEGIPTYKAEPSEVIGAVTRSAPYKIALSVKDEKGNVKKNGIVWRLEKLGGSKRIPAVIEGGTGELTIYESGLIKISAIDMGELKFGEAVIHINTLIKTADDAEESNISASLPGASGDKEGANCISETKNYRLEFKDVFAEGLSGIKIRCLPKNGVSTINVSLGRSSAPRDLLGSATAKETGGQTGWREIEIGIDEGVLGGAKKDENGLTTLYVQMNGAVFDYMRLEYEDINDAVPYKIAEITDADGGVIDVSLKYIGSSREPRGVLTAVIYDKDGRAASHTESKVCGGGKYRLDGGYSPGDRICVFVLSDSDDGEALSERFEHIYNTPKRTNVIVYSASDERYAGFFTDKNGEKLPEIDGLTGYGLYERPDRRAPFDFEYGGKVYTFSSAWRSREGNETQSCLFFTPKASCSLTVIFDGNGGEGRAQHIVQNGVKLSSENSTVNGVTVLSRRITDLSSPVYTYGDGQNKNIYALIVEYDDCGGSDDGETEIVKQISWNDSTVRLTRSLTNGNTKLSVSELENIWTELTPCMFKESDIVLTGDEEFRINDIAVFGENLFAACDKGALLIFKNCMKCNILKKPCEADIAALSVQGKTISGYAENGDKLFELDRDFYETKK